MISPATLSLPNLVTLSRILAIPLFLILLFFGNPWAAALFFLLIAATDALDGWLARRLSQTSDLGKLLDPLADKILIISALIALIEVRGIPAFPVILIVGRDLTVSLVRLNAAQAGEIIGASFWGKIKTTSQVLAVWMLILSWPYALTVLWVAVILALLSGVDYLVRR